MKQMSYNTRKEMKLSDYSQRVLHSKQLPERVCLMTFVNTKNYGALLQAFSLKEIIVSFGYECSFINYQNKKLDYSTISRWRRIRSIIWQNTVCRLTVNSKRMERTKKFQIQMLGLRPPKYRMPQELKKISDSADVYIVGSDQVWNPELIADDDSYFLSFTSRKKIAYAASFGKNCVDRKFLFSHANDLKQFHAISVREKTGADNLKKVLGINAEVLLDPVFLMNMEEWSKKLGLDKKEDIFPTKYILCYVMSDITKKADKIYTVAKNMAENRGARLITLKNNGIRVARSKEIIDYSAGPKEFVNYIAKADCIVTDSFHGMAFSIIFRKNFWTVMSKESFGKRNTRIRELQQRLGLENRSIFIEEPIPDMLTLSDCVDYNSVECILNDAVRRSKKYLFCSLTE